MTVSMSKIKQQNATIIDNTFIDEYMPAANGEFVKVYLYMLRRGMSEISDEEIADALDMTVKDVQRAFAYWKKAGLLEDADIAATEKAVPEKKKADIVALSEDEEFSAMLHATRKFLGKDAYTHAEVETLSYMYDELKLPGELIEYLVEKCAENGKTSLRYIEKVAIDWHKRGIDSVEKAKGDAELYASQISCVMKAFGIKDRAPAEAEIVFIKKWFNEWKLSNELVSDACARTITSTAKPSFKYADTILKKWHENDVQSKEDIDKLDKAHEKTAGKAAFSNNNPANIHSNAQYDAIMREYDALQRKNKEEASKRVEEIYFKIPRIKELDEMVRSLSVESVKQRLAGGDGSDYAARIENVKKEKAQLLAKAGFAPDYMEIRYTCKDCKDTGLVEGKKCHCFIEKENLLKEGKL